MDTEKGQIPAQISFVAHENAMMHYNNANHRMLVALLAVCVTFILTIIIFVVGYTIRERNWLNTLTRLQVTEARTNGIYEQSDYQPD